MSISADNVLSAKNLSESMYKCLPKEPQPQLKNPYDAIALLSHACMLAVGFRLIGLSEDQKLGNLPLLPSPSAAKIPTNNHQDLPSTTDSDSSSSPPLPKEWNAHPTYTFHYAHTQSSLTYLLTLTRLGPKAILNGLALHTEKVHSLDLLTKDFISDSSLPLTFSGNEGPNEAALALRAVFISAGRMTDAASLLKVCIIQKLAPGLRKEGYEEGGGGSSSAHAAAPPAERPEREGRQPPQHDPLRDDRFAPRPHPHPFNDPLAAEPRRPYPVGDFPPPGFEDEYEINRPRGGIGGERRPLNIGERDLYPPGLGPRDPLRGGVGGGGGMYPTFDELTGGGAGGGGYDAQYVSMSFFLSSFSGCILLTGFCFVRTGSR